MASEQLIALHYQLSDRLAEIAKLFQTETKITLIVRTPELEDGGVFISEDDADAVIAEINRLRHKNPVV